jgi:hypothetical protein
VVGCAVRDPNPNPLMSRPSLWSSSNLCLELRRRGPWVVVMCTQAVVCALVLVGELSPADHRAPTGPVEVLLVVALLCSQGLHVVQEALDLGGYNVGVAAEQAFAAG